MSMKYRKPCDLLVCLSYSLNLPNENRVVFQTTEEKRMMRMFKTPIFMVIGFVFSMVLARAEVDMGKQVDTLNQFKTPESMAPVLKNFFRTAEDHRHIDMDVKNASKTVKKWNWMYDTENNKIAFVSNGKVRFHFQLRDLNKREFVFNGQKFIMNPLLSYINHKKRLLKIMDTKQGVLESLLIKKSHAVTPLVAFALFGLGILIGMNIRSSNSKSSAPVGSTNAPGERTGAGVGNGRTSETRSNNRFAYRCAENMGDSYYSRFEGISTLFPSHFQENHHYRKAYRFYGLNDRMLSIIRKYSGMNSKKPHFSNVEGCIEAKTSPRYNREEDWGGLKKEYAKAHCEGAWAIYQECLRGSQVSGEVELLETDESGSVK